MRQTWINSYTSERRHLTIIVPPYILHVVNNTNVKQIAFHQGQGYRLYIYIQE